MTDAQVRLIIKTLEENKKHQIKLLLECWNAEKPHFNGVSPHRYDGHSKRCWHCNRPKNWQKVNALIESELVSSMIGCKK